MAFSNPAGQRMSNTYYAELRTAIEERLPVFNQGTPVWSTSARRAQRWYSDIDLVRQICEKLIDGSYSGQFVKSDLTTWANIGAVLTAAGYPGGWYSLGTIENNLIIKQCQDVLGQLKKYGRRITGSGLTSPSGSGVREGGGDEGMEAIWDEMVADAPTANAGQVAYWDMLQRQPDQSDLISSNGPRFRARYNFGSLVGTLVKFLFVANGNNDTLNNQLLAAVDFDVVDPAFSYTVSPGDAADSHVVTLEVTSGITLPNSATDIEWGFTDSYPADLPFDFDPFDFSQEGTLACGMGDPASGYNIYVDITSALTYG